MRNPVPLQVSTPRSVLSSQGLATSPLLRGAAETEAARPTRTRMKARILTLKKLLIFEGLNVGKMFRRKFV